MAKTQSARRTATKYKNIYFNETTKKYDVKYNFTEFDPITGKNKYRSKWVYSNATIAEAKKALADMEANGVKPKETEITLQGAYELWKIEAAADNLSKVTVRNTEQQFNMLTQFIPPIVKMKSITADIYKDTMKKCRDHGYSEETLHSINATFRKLIRLCYSKKLINENILDSCKNFKTKQKEEYRVITKEEYDKLDAYFAADGFRRLGVDNYRNYRLLFAILYFCGLRIGEALALTYNDIEQFDYYPQGKAPNIWVVPSDADTGDSHLRGKRIKITKAYVTKTNEIKEPKNSKSRTIPINAHVDRLLGYINNATEYQTNPKKRKERLFPWTDGAVNQTLKRACDRLGIEPFSCHTFRHTYISNLIRNGVPLPVIEKVSGDTQATILRRYSHMFEQDERIVISALKNM